MAQEDTKGLINPDGEAIDNLSAEFAKRRLSYKIDPKKIYTGGLPVRLELAARFMEGTISRWGAQQMDNEEIAICFKISDAMIEKFNNDLKEG